jgi:hypothetical protein
MKKGFFVFLLIVLRVSFSYGQWDSLGSGIKGANNDVYAQIVYNGSLYFGGEFDSAGSLQVTSQAIWNGSTWNKFSKITNGGIVLGYGIYNGNLIVEGIFDSIGGIKANNIASWNGISWSALGAGISGACYVMTVYNGDLYVGGSFLLSGSYNMAMWNGSTWLPVESGIYTNGKTKTYSAAIALTVYQGNLYVGGRFDSAGRVAANNIAKWNDTNWSAVGSGFQDSLINAFTLFNGELYAAGYVGSFTKSIGVIDKWNGTSWSPVGTGLAGKLSNIFALTVFDSSVCVGGIFDSIGGISANSIAYWNGSNWGTFGTGINDVIYALGVYNSQLYVSGHFNNAGNVVANNVAVWSGTVGIPEISILNTFSAFPNPNTGIFTINLSNFRERSYLKIYNVLGENIYSSGLNTSNTEVDLSNNSSGIYLYRITTETGNLIGEGKVIIQK